MFSFLPETLAIREAFVLTMGALSFTLPIMIFNYIIGVLSARLSSMSDVIREEIIMYSVIGCMWGAVGCEPLKRFYRFFRKSPDTNLHLTICLPATDATLIK